MTQTSPLVSVVVETVTPRDEVVSDGPLAEELSGALAEMPRQTYPSDLIETIVVVDEGVPEAERQEIVRRFPSVRLVEAPAMNYFAAKNAGAAAAHGEIVALIDGDCVPAADWLERLVARFERGVDAVAGQSRYVGEALLWRTLSVPGLGYVLEDESGSATGFNLNSVAFRREVIREHPLDARIRRHGGCYLLYNQLRADGARIVYEPRARTVHGIDGLKGLGAVRKHFGRGYDAVTVYRLDDRGVLRGTRPFRRFGGAALVAITANRILGDWRRLARRRHQIGFRPAALPYLALVIVPIRLLELAGSIAALVAPDLYERRSARR
jgi:cellulose synthase/poly-beta-1,6-N-acetylglucosamine synthase-like glycosyltransferase